MSTQSAAERTALDRVAFLEALCCAVPFHIVDAVLTEPKESVVGDEAFEGSMMFVDVVGFTAMCERLASSGSDGLSKLSQVLDELFQYLLDEAVFPYGGYVVQFGGDSMTVFFRGDDHVRRGVAAALSCQRIMHGETGRLIAGKSRDLMLRIGLSTGPIRLRIVGDLHRRTVVAAGSSAHESLELQQLAEPNTILADSHTIKLLSGNIEVVDRRNNRGVVRGLRSWPPTMKFRTIAGRLTDQTEEKISLLQPFVPRPLARRMRSTPSGWRIGGELREVVVLFAELWGLDGAKAVAQPEIVRNVARSLLRAYQKYGGIVAKVDLAERGHRIMAIFGLHMPADNDGERALLAGLEATTRLRAYTVSAHIDVSIRTGLHAGRAYFGAIGSANRHDITVVGDSVNVAARVAAAAQPFGVSTTMAVLDRSKCEFTYTARGPVQVKGKSDELDLYEVHGAAGGAAHYVQARGAERFVVGREAEASQLDAAVQGALAGQGRVVGIQGDAGAGKSFHLSAVINQWRKAGGVGAIGRCRLATRSIPFAPVVAMFENYLGLEPGDSEDSRREKIRSGLMGLNLHRRAPELISLLQPVVRPDGTGEALFDLADIGARERVLGTVVEFLEARIEREALLYILEDVHLADTLTLELAQRLSAAGRSGRFLMVATYRPTPHLKTLRAGFDLEVDLGKFSLADTGAMVAHLMGAEVTDEDLALLLWERSRGNPWQLEETVRYLAERELLSRERGIVRPGATGMQPLQEIVPTSVAHVALASLDDLGSVERRVLRMASALGARFDPGVLVQVASAELEEELVQSAIETLEGRRLIVRSGTDASGMAFRDPGTRVVVYGTLPEIESRETHRRIAEILQELPEGSLFRVPAAIALHHERALQWADAVEWYFEAARVAIRAGLDKEAAEFVDSWHSMASHLGPDEAPSAKRRARVALLGLVATGRQGSPASTLAVGREVVAEHWTLLNEAARCAVDLWLGTALAASGRPDKARGRLQGVFESSERAPMRSDAARVIAQTYEYANDWKSARHWLSLAREHANGDTMRLLRIELMQAGALIGEGKLDGAAKIYRSVKAQTARREHMPIAASASIGMGHCDMLRGDFDAAITGFEQAEVLARALRSEAEEASILIKLGQTYLWAEKPKVAEPILQRAVALAKELGNRLLAGEGLVHLGLAKALLGDLPGGLALCEMGHRRAIRGGVRDVEVIGELHLLRIAILTGDRGAAEIAAGRAEAHGDHLRNIPLYSRVLAKQKAAAEKLFA